MVRTVCKLEALLDNISRLKGLLSDQPFRASRITFAVHNVGPEQSL